MSYFATKDGITKVIQKHSRKDYENMGWTITTDGNNLYDPYDYNDVMNNRLEPIVINGEVFEGYSSFFCINTKTYVEEPSRTLDGSIPNINDYDTFIVPRVKISFKYMDIKDFRRFLKAITPNEFPVSYYDYEIDQIVSYKMYIEPREMSKIFNIGFEILAITEQEISLIGTLNDMDYLTINYYDNITNIQSNPEYNGERPNDYILFDNKQMVFGNYYSISSGNLQHNKPTSDNNKYRFVRWNTKPDGTGLNYLPNETIQASNNLNLYAQWVVAND